MDNMDPAQFKMMMDMMKSNPAMMDTVIAMNPAMKGMDKDQLIKQLEMMSNMSPEQLKSMMSMASRVQKVSAPALRIWNMVNGWFGGKLLMALGVVVVGIVGSFIYSRFFSAAAPLEDTFHDMNDLQARAQDNLPAEEFEFDEFGEEA